MRQRLADNAKQGVDGARKLREYDSVLLTRTQPYAEIREQYASATPSGQPVSNAATTVHQQLSLIHI